MNKKTIFILVLFLISSKIYGQNKENSEWFPEIRLISGFVVDHSNSMAFAIKKPIKAIDINILRQSNGRKRWHQYYNFPITGFGYQYTDLGNPKVLGYSHSLYGIVNLPLLKCKNGSLNFNSNIGLAYFTTYFNAENNIYNSAMGSHFNSYFDFSFDAQFKIFKAFYVGQSIGLTHSSNGLTNTPNLGINLLSYRIAFRKANYKEEVLEKIPKNKFDKKWNFNFISSYGLRERYYPGGVKYFVHSLMFNAEKPINAKGSLNVGADYFYDSSIKLAFARDSIFNSRFIDKTYVGIHLGYSVIFDQISIIIQQGYKIYTNEPGTQKLYQRIGANYKHSKHLVLNLALRTYFAKAEFVEIGFGYRWSKKK